MRRVGPARALGSVLEDAGAGTARLDRGGLTGVGRLTRRRNRLACGRVLVVGDAAGYEQPQLEAYCDCAAEEVSGEFSESEMQALTSQSPADTALQERMTQVTSTCSSRIKPNPD